MKNIFFFFLVCFSAWCPTHYPTAVVLGLISIQSTEFHLNRPTMKRRTTNIIRLNISVELFLSCSKIANFRTLEQQTAAVVGIQASGCAEQLFTRDENCRADKVAFSNLSHGRTFGSVSTPPVKWAIDGVVGFTITSQQNVSSLIQVDLVLRGAADAPRTRSA
jgi:hypothetical protein